MQLVRRREARVADVPNEGTQGTAAGQHPGVAELRHIGILVVRGIHQKK